MFLLHGNPEVDHQFKNVTFSDVLNATLQVSIRDAELSVDMLAAHSRQSFSQWFISFLISTLKKSDLLFKNEESAEFETGILK